jgi:hypothetical protein
MRKIVDYITVVERSDNLAQEVNKKIREGYQPHGRPYEIPDMAFIGQVMVKYEDKEE